MFVWHAYKSFFTKPTYVVSTRTLFIFFFSKKFNALLALVKTYAIFAEKNWKNSFEMTSHRHEN